MRCHTAKVSDRAGMLGEFPVKVGHPHVRDPKSGLTTTSENHIVIILLEVLGENFLGEVCTLGDIIRRHP